MIVKLAVNDYWLVFIYFLIKKYDRLSRRSGGLEIQDLMCEIFFMGSKPRIKF
jgi:hypothetical protein